MSFLNFFKSKENNTINQLERNPKRVNCDLAKTEIIVELLKTKKENRDSKWINTFFENIKFASFSESIPQIIFGEDNFPYFVLKTGEHLNPFETYCISNMMDTILLNRGMGVVINPDKNSSEWSFTYGDILNLHLNNEFISIPDTLDGSEDVKNTDHSEIHIISPPEKFLPNFSRNVIKFFLQKKGIKKPKVMLISKINGQSINKELVFNIHMEDYESKDKYNLLMNQLKWYLPRHYNVTALTRKSELVKKFEDL